MENNIKPHVLMVCECWFVSISFFSEALNTRAAYDTCSCPHLHMFGSFGVSCSHCNPMILWRTTDGVSVVLALSPWLQRDTTISMGNSPVPRTWPQTVPWEWLGGLLAPQRTTPGQLPETQMGQGLIFQMLFTIFHALCCYQHHSLWGASRAAGKLLITLHLSEVWL